MEEWSGIVTLYRAPVVQTGACSTLGGGGVEPDGGELTGALRSRSAVPGWNLCTWPLLAPFR